MKQAPNSKGNIAQQGSPKFDGAQKSVKAGQPPPGISNSGGQMSYQTDNKQASVNKGNQDPAVQGKKQAPKKPADRGPK